MATKKQYLSTRVDAKTKQQVRELAQREQRTISQTVAFLVTEALRSRQSKEQAA